MLWRLQSRWAGLKRKNPGRQLKPYAGYRGKQWGQLRAQQPRKTDLRESGSDGHYHQGSTLPQTLLLFLPLGVCIETLTSEEANYLVFCFFLCVFFCHKAYGIFPDQELNSCHLCWKRRILTTGPPGKSRKWPCYDALGLDPNTAGENSFKRVRISQASPHQSSPLCAHFHSLLAKKGPSSRLTTRPSSEEKRMGSREAMLT